MTAGFQTLGWVAGAGLCWLLGASCQREARPAFKPPHWPAGPHGTESLGTKAVVPGPNQTGEKNSDPIAPLQTATADAHSGLRVAEGTEPAASASDFVFLQKNRPDGSADLVAAAGTAVAVVSARPMSQLSGGPWSVARGDLQRTGRSPGILPVRKPQLVWRFATAGRISAAVAQVSDGLIAFGSHDRHIYALTREGKLVWKFPTQDMIFATPVISPAGLVLVGSDDDRLYGLSLTEGTRVFATAPGRCKRSVGVGSEASRCDIEGVTPGPSGALYVNGDGITALSATGQIVWRYPVEKKHCGSAPSIGFDGTLHAVCQDLLIRLRPDGTLLHQTVLGFDLAESPALGADGTAYLGSEDKRLYAVAPNGTIQFTVLTGGPVRAAVALQKDGTVVFGSLDGFLYAVRADGTLLWKFRSAGPILSAPIVDREGRLLFGSQDQRLYALSADGQLLWQYVFSADVDGSPFLADDGSILIGTDDGYLYSHGSDGNIKRD